MAHSIPTANNSSSVQWLQLFRERSSQSEAFCGRFVQFLKRFGIFYLCNGCSITGFLPLQRCGTWCRSICTTRTSLCYLIAKDKNSQNLSKIEQKSSVLTRTLSTVNHGARGHTTKIILWGSRSSIVISRRHKGEATTSTTSSTSTLVGAHPCLLIPKAQITSNHYFPKESPFD